MDHRVADLVVTRAGGVCERCRSRPAEQIHHRRPRGMGGTKKPDVASNLVHICARCHREVERFRMQAIWDGWIVRQSHDPIRTPVRLMPGQWMVLDDEGTFTLNRERPDIDG